MTTARKTRRTISPLDRKIASAVEVLHGLVQMSPEWEAQVMVVRALRAEKDAARAPEAFCSIDSGIHPTRLLDGRVIRAAA